jgi:ribose 5-phosphate isomerase B
MSALYIAADHAGFEMKEALKKYFHSVIQIKDLGPHSSDSVDYPNWADALCLKLLEEHASPAERLKPLGILVCGSGVGMDIAANRHRGIRAVLAYSEEVAKLSRMHNASNVVCFGSRLQTVEQVEKIIRTWVATPFEGGRHQRRVDLMGV